MARGKWQIAVEMVLAPRRDDDSGFKDGEAKWKQKYAVFMYESLKQVNSATHSPTAILLLTKLHMYRAGGMQRRRMYTSAADSRTMSLLCLR